MSKAGPPSLKALYEIALRLMEDPKAKPSDKAKVFQSTVALIRGRRKPPKNKKDKSRRVVGRPFTPKATELDSDAKKTQFLDDLLHEHPQNS